MPEHPLNKDIDLSDIPCGHCGDPYCHYCDAYNRNFRNNPKSDNDTPDKTKPSWKNYLYKEVKNQVEWAETYLENLQRALTARTKALQDQKIAQETNNLELVKIAEKDLEKQNTDFRLWAKTVVDDVIPYFHKLLDDKEQFLQGLKNKGCSAQQAEEVVLEIQQLIHHLNEAVPDTFESDIRNLREIHLEESRKKRLQRD